MYVSISLTTTYIFFLSIGNGRINLLPTYAYDFEVDVEF